jgi:NCS1 family nucleobase:cation symporter-1
MTPAGAAPSITSVEHRGIEYVPVEERWGKPGNLFWMWAGAIWNVEFLLYGVLAIVVFGLSFPQAVLIIVVGNLSYVLTGLCSVQGPRAGTTAFGVSRAAFGPNGNRVPSLFNWVTQVGFEIEGIALIVFAGIALANRAGVNPVPSWVKVIFLLVAVIIQSVLPLLGHAAVLKVLRILAFPFIVLFVIMTFFVVHRYHAGPPSAGWGSMTIFLALVISAGGLGWTENGNDYSRYLPPSVSKRGIILAVMFGGLIPSILLEVLGAALGAELPKTAETSVTGLTAGFPSWFVVPYLIFAIFQLFSINTLDLYSSGVTLQSLVPKLHRVTCVFIDATICLAVAAYAVFSSRFYSLLTDFLLFIILWLGPWCAIYLVDCWLRKNSYDSGSLLNETGGLYYRNRGFHWPALAAQALGMVTAALWLNAFPPYVGPLASRFGGSFGSDFSVFIGLAVGGIVYFLLASRSVRAESELTLVA